MPMSPFYLAMPARLDQAFCHQLDIILAYSRPAAAMIPLKAVQDEAFAGNCIRQLHENGCAVLVGAASSEAGRAMEAIGKNGADGLHLTDATDYARIRKTLDKRLMAGVFCGTSRHDVMLVGEAGADYIAYGTPCASEGKTASQQKNIEMTKWLNEIIEVPNVFWEAHSASEVTQFLEYGADFVAFGTYLWDNIENTSSLHTGTDLLPPPV